MFQVVQIEKRTTPLQRARTAGSENGMVCHVSMKTFRDMRDQNLKNANKMLNQQVFSDIRSLISRKVFIETSHIIPFLEPTFRDLYNSATHFFNMSNFKN